MDESYELDELLPSVLKRIRELYGKAAAAAHSWSNAEDRDAAVQQKTLLSSCNGAVSVAQWAVNKAVHHRRTSSRL